MNAQTNECMYVYVFVSLFIGLCKLDLNGIHNIYKYINNIIHIFYLFIISWILNPIKIVDN